MQVPQGAAQPVGTCSNRAILPCLAPLWPCPQILSRYDIAVVQEVRDSHLTAVGRLLDILNQWVMVGGLGRHSTVTLPPGHGTAA